MQKKSFHLPKDVILMSDDTKIGLNVIEAANLLGISKGLMSELVKLPDFPCIKFKRRIVINKKQLQEWFDKNSGRFFV